MRTSQEQIIREKLTIVNAEGQQLAVLLERPLGDPRAYAIFAHCFTCSKHIGVATRISRALAERGFAVVRFDFTGLGNSEGDFANTNFSSNVADLLAIADGLKTSHAAPALLIGHSLGGTAVLSAASRLPECRAVVTIGAPSDPARVANLFAERRDAIEAAGRAEAVLAGRRFAVQKQFLAEFDNQTLLEDVRKLRKALLILHSPVDDIVHVNHARDIYLAARHPKSFISLDEADHLLSRAEDSDYVAETVAAWAGRYVEDSQRHEMHLTRPSVAEDEVLVRELAGPYTQEVISGKHRLLSDEPTAVGGKDMGLSPYELLTAALGSCTAMTLRMYAEHKGLDLGRVSVRLQHEKVHAKDCDECETREGKVDWIERVIEIEGELDPKLEQRLLRIADKCPVHRTLHSEVIVATRMRD